MRYEIAICRHCGSKRPIVNKRHWLCPECNTKRLHPEGREVKPIKAKRFSESFQYDKRWGFNSEVGMYEWIMQSRDHVSFFTVDC